MFKNFPKTLVQLHKIVNSSKRYAGHSKWQNIRHIKGAKDLERSVLFARLARQMKVAVTEGGNVDPKSNPKLDNVIQQAHRANMPSATIQSVLRSCETDKSNSKPHLLELRGPGGSIILCEVFTSQLHILKQNISTILKKHHCKYSDGGGQHLFEEKGIILAEIEKGKSEEEILEVATEHAIEAGAEDVRIVDKNEIEFTCGSTNLKKVTENLERQYKIISASSEFIPLKCQELSEEELKVCGSLYEKLENLPEVVRLSDNVA